MEAIDQARRPGVRADLPAARAAAALRAGGRGSPRAPRRARPSSNRNRWATFQPGSSPGPIHRTYRSVTIRSSFGPSGVYVFAFSASSSQGSPLMRSNASGIRWTRCAVPPAARRTPTGSSSAATARAPLADAEPPREVRKTVTVVFCDLTGSTALGDVTDPETLRATMRGYYDEMRTILERHGGTVEKFIGDAVMAVFGVPVSHEDDALRAVRAAWEMRAAVPALGLQRADRRQHRRGRRGRGRHARHR